MATIMTATASTAANLSGENTVVLDEAAVGAAQENQREKILAPPGSGAVLGVWMYNGIVYAFRNNASATEAVMYKSTSSGWEKVELFWTLDFDAGTAAFTAGETLTGGTSGATATVKKVVVESGSFAGNDADGYLVLSDVDGHFADNETITDGASGSATVDGVLSKITLSPSGRYEFVNYNFRGHTESQNMYFADGVNQAHEFDGTTVTPIRTGMTEDTPAYIIAHKYHLFLSFSGGSIQHSSIGDPLSWSAVLGATEIALGDECSGFVIERDDVLGIYTRNDTYFLYGTSAADWNLKRLNQGSGAVPRSVQKVGMTWVLDNRGITTVAATEAHGDFQQATVSAKVQDFVEDNLGNLQSSVRVRDKNQYRLYYNNLRGLTVTFYNNRVIGIMPFRLTDQFNCTYSCDDTDGAEVLLAGGNDGYVYRVDSGTSHDGEDLNAYVRTVYHHYGNPDVLKVFRGLTLEFESDSNEVLNVVPDYSYSDTSIPESLVYSGQVYASGAFWNTDDWNSFYWSAPAVSRGRIRISGVGTNMGVLVYSSTKYKQPVILQGATVEYANRGLRR